MLYPREHAARVNDPGKYASFARKNIAPGIDIVLGISGKKSETQAYRFSKANFTAAEARAWLKDHDVNPIKFEAASENRDRRDYSMTAAQLAKNSITNFLQTNQTRGPGQMQGDPNYGVNLGKERAAKDKADGLGNKGVSMGNEAYKTTADAKCDTCDGSGDCTHCDGSGKCADCDGKGWIKDDQGHKPDCKTCEGTGDCQHCEGTGDCGDCGGEGLKQDDPDDPKTGNDDPDNLGNSPKKVADKKKQAASMDKGKKDRLDATRCDRMDMTPDWMVSKFERTPDGFLKGRAVVTTVGVFEYKNTDGLTRRELRLPEEVFSVDSLNTMKLKPVVNTHPDPKKSGGKVTPQNYKELAVGSLGDNPSTNYGNWSDGLPVGDGFRVSVDMIITDEDAIRDVQNGKRALSCGYDCDIEKADAGARWMGQPYDFIQRRIRYNHVAIENVARAGDDATIRMDSAESYAGVLISKRQEVKMPTLKTTHLDGVEYEAEAEVITALTKTTARADALETELKTLRADSAKLAGEKDNLTAKISSLETELASFKADAADPKKIAVLVKNRKTVEDAATAAGVQFNADASDEDIRKAVIGKVYLNTDLTGKTAEYISARFDGAVDLLAARVEGQKRAALLGDNMPPADKPGTDGTARADAAPETVYKTGRQKYIESLRANSRKLD